MTSVSVQELKNNLSGFLRRIEAGESFLIVRGEQPVAEFRPVAPAVAASAAPRPFGLCAGQFEVPAHFDQPLPEDVMKEFESA